MSTDYTISFNIFWFMQQLVLWFQFFRKIFYQVCIICFMNLTFSTTSSFYIYTFMNKGTCDLKITKMWLRTKCFAQRDFRETKDEMILATHEFEGKELHFFLLYYHAHVSSVYIRWLFVVNDKHWVIKMIFIFSKAICLVTYGTRA